MVAQSVSELRPDNLPKAPVAPETLTISKIRAAVPARCFKRSLWRSLQHVTVDLVIIAALGIAMRWIEMNAGAYGLPKWVVSWIVFPMYWFWQGSFMTGIWVLAHECGHQAFSPWKSVNDAFGLLLHSALLVPYHSWRITHGQHHKNTNHMDNDQVFVPSTREEYHVTKGIELEHGVRRYKHSIVQAVEETPLGDLFGIVQMLLFGWWAYLTTNIAGQNYGKGANHYNPKAPMYAPRDYWDVVVSDIGIAAALSILGGCIYRFGLVNVLRYYFFPYMVVNMWLVLYTYLHHSDPAVPHYTPKEFNFVRGALCSVDRDYGIFNIIHHHIGDTHVAHHLFSQMPFYHAQEATEAIKKVLGEYYCHDDSGILEALGRSWSTCKFVDPADGDIMYYRNYKMEKMAEKQQ